MSLGGLKKQINKANQVVMLIICSFCSALSVCSHRRLVTRVVWLVRWSRFYSATCVTDGTAAKCWSPFFTRN